MEWRMARGLQREAHCRREATRALEPQLPPVLARFILFKPGEEQMFTAHPLASAVQTTTWLALAIRHENPAFVYRPSTKSRL